MICVCPEPFAFIVQIFPTGLRPLVGVRWKAIFVPSGEKVGNRSWPFGSLEMFVTSVPIGVIVKIWATPVRVLLKAIFVPSGDHEGWESPSNVIRFGFVQSLFTIQIPPLTLKAICDPSGE